MAIDKSAWKKAKLLFEHGKSLTEISKITGINRSTISKKSKVDEWIKFDKKSTLVSSEVDTIIKQNEINHEKSTLTKEELIFHNQEVADTLRRKNLVFGNAEKFLGKLDKLSDEVDNGIEMKAIIEANHKAGQTLGVVEQFAPKTVIENKNAQQNNTPTQIVIHRDE